MKRRWIYLVTCEHGEIVFGCYSSAVKARAARDKLDISAPFRHPVVRQCALDAPPHMDFLKVPYASPSSS